MEYNSAPSGENEVLVHWGIKGMQWGVRRYQRKDGSLTPAGEKRLKRENAKLRKEEQVLKNRKATQAKFDRLAARKKKLEDDKEEFDGIPSKNKKGKKDATDDSANPTAKKSIKDMSDTELREHTARMIAEKNYLDAQRQLSALTPATTSKGKQFANEALNNVVKPVAMDMGKKMLTKFLTEKLGLKDAESASALLKKEADDWVNKDRMEAAKDRISDREAKRAAKKAEKEAKKEEKKIEAEMDKYRKFQEDYAKSLEPSSEYRYRSGSKVNSETNSSGSSSSSSDSTRLALPAPKSEGPKSNTSTNPSPTSGPSTRLALPEPKSTSTALSTYVSSFGKSSTKSLPESTTSRGESKILDLIQGDDGKYYFPVDD